MNFGGARIGGGGGAQPANDAGAAVDIMSWYVPVLDYSTVQYSTVEYSTVQ